MTLTYNVIQFILVLIGFTAFVFIGVPLLKILVMIDVFGWDKTKELLQNPDWEFPTDSGVRQKTAKALQELEAEKTSGGRQ